MGLPVVGAVTGVEEAEVGLGAGDTPGGVGPDGDKEDTAAMVADDMLATEQRAVWRVQSE